ncbi:MAG TPA: glycine--tRNA ligase [Candidatus Saccharimonadales bacterium]|nr:glycine--tRNA ligase [Candidatus Saccharimonadales bacterium]
MSDISLEDIASLAKRRGFIYQGSDIYGGLAGTWDYGPLGVALKRNLVNAWWKFFVDSRDDMYGIESAILMNPKVWVASGHVATFNDPLIEDVKTKKRYRLDHLLEDNGIDNAASMSMEQMVQTIQEKGLKSPDGNDLANPAAFNLLFKTSIGAVENEASSVYLRGETAQGMFTNYKNIVDSFYPDLPFGIAQVGKAFRNEISPRDFIFRVREFEIAEFEYFIHPESWQEEFEKWRALMHDWFVSIGLPAEKIHELEVPEADRAHYSKRTMDFEFAYPFGTKEIAGLAYRTDFDLQNHQRDSGKSMDYRPKAGGEPFVPHVIEPTFGVDRHVLAVLANAYTVDEMNGDQRVYLKLPKQLAPIKAAVSPLLKNKPELATKAKEVYDMLKKELGAVMWDDNGNIGKRYRRQDEIGTPACIVIDFQTLEDNTVTVRDRDSAEQQRIAVDKLLASL